MTKLLPFSLDRMVRAVEKVRERLLCATAVLEQAGIPYAVAGGHAVAAWVARVDEAAVRNTRDVEILLRREDLGAARRAFEAAGFRHRSVSGLDEFLDGPDASVRDAVHIVFAGKKVRPDEPAANPDVSESVAADAFRILSLEALVRIKLPAFRDKDRTHLRDLIDVGLIDAGWRDRLAAALAERLQELLDTPDG
jgi:hypothetical protein